MNAALLQAFLYPGVFIVIVIVFGLMIKYDD